MKKLLLCGIAFIMVLASEAQLTLSGAEFTSMAGFTGGSYTRDSLVFPSRKGKITFQGESFFTGLLKFTTDDDRMAFYAGLGLNTHFKSMNKSGIDDALMLLVTAGFGSSRPDTFKLKQAKLTTFYLSLPVGIDYSFTKRPDARISTHFRVLLVPSFRMGGNAVVAFDSTFHIPTLQQKTETETVYKAAPRKFSMSMMPEINVCYRPFDTDFGFQMGVFPITLDLFSPNRKLINSSLGMRASFGIFYNWN